MSTIAIGQSRLEASSVCLLRDDHPGSSSAPTRPSWSDTSMVTRRLSTSSSSDTSRVRSPGSSSERAPRIVREISTRSCSCGFIEDATPLILVARLRRGFFRSRIDCSSMTSGAPGERRRFPSTKESLAHPSRARAMRWLTDSTSRSYSKGSRPTSDTFWFPRRAKVSVTRSLRHGSASPSMRSGRWSRGRCCGCAPRLLPGPWRLSGTAATQRALQRNE